MGLDGPGWALMGLDGPWGMLWAYGMRPEFLMSSSQKFWEMCIKNSHARWSPRFRIVFHIPVDIIYIYIHIMYHLFWRAACFGSETNAKMNIEVRTWLASANNSHSNAHYPILSTSLGSVVSIHWSPSLFLCQGASDKPSSDGNGQQSLTWEVVFFFPGKELQTPVERWGKNKKHDRLTDMVTWYLLIFSLDHIM